MEEEPGVIDFETLCADDPEHCDLIMEEKLKSGVSPQTDMIMPDEVTIDPELQQLMELLSNPWVMAAFVAITIWAAVWKGFALWRAAKNSQLYWFIALLVVNSMGILEILYLFVFSKKTTKKTTKKSKAKKSSDPITI